MNNKAIKLLRVVYGIVVSVMTAISGLLLTAACLQIYRSGGEQIYTPEKVAAAFAPISLPIYITLALICGSFLLAFLLPVDKKRISVQKQYALLLKKAYERVDLQICNAELLPKLKQEQKKRRTMLILSLAVWAVGSIIFLPYACNGSNYSQELHLATDSVIAVVWWLLPCSLIPTAFSIFAAYYCRSSIRRELELVKLAPKRTEKAVCDVKTAGQGLLYARLAILAIALVLIIGGYVAGGTVDVLAKAVAICTECVGLG